MRKRPSYPIRLLAKSLASLVAVAIAATCSFAGAPPAPGQVGLDYISHVRIGTSMCDTCPPRVCPGEPVVVTVSGVLPTGCVAFRGLRDLPVGAPFTVLAADFVVDTCGVACPASFTEFSASVTLPPAVPGFQRFTLISQVRTCPDTNVVASSRSHEFVYEVEPECLGTPPLDSLVRSFTSFRISPERRCHGDSLTLQLVKNGCPPCVHLQSLTYDPALGFEAVVNWTPLCAELRCVPETLSVALGRFAAGSHRLAADVHVRVLGTVVQDSVIAFTEFVAFDVPRDCGDPILDCLEPELPASGLPQRACGVTVARGGRGDVLVPIRTWVPAAGVQGYLDVSPRFRIVDMAYAGPAGGVHVSWAQDGMRTRFILFGGTADVVPVGISNLLRVTVEHDSTYQDSTARFASWGTLNGRVEIASGPNGESIALCPSILLSLPPVIRLCIKSEPATCDANQDGHSDVRDLVLMTRCLWHELSPEDRARMCMDCDQDGVFAFQDLVCCARHILRLPLVPRDSVQANDALHVSFDEPQRDGDGWLVRVRLTGANARHRAGHVGQHVYGRRDARRQEALRGLEQQRQQRSGGGRDDDSRERREAPDERKRAQQAIGEVAEEIRGNIESRDFGF